ncbi:MAG: hypothetical protein KatS3mg051_2251 [Anaerolineae bacterium]|nr:MAG: hypothetical protein KatS3mg051_2251 [Anaerolineae bacterium]
MEGIRPVNTLAHLSGTLALIWLAVFALQTLGEEALGVALAGAALLFLVLTILAAVDDWRILTGRPDGRDD